MTFWATPPFHFLKNEKSLLMAGFLTTARCRHRFRTQTCPNPFEFFFIRHQPVNYVLLPVGVFLFRVSGRWLSGRRPLAVLVPPLFDSAIFAEDEKPALRRRRQDYAVARDCILNT